MIKHVMIDTETLGLAPNSTILQIGAVVFDTEGVISRHKWNIEFKDDVQNRYIDSSTQKWWSEQSPEARALVFDAPDRHTLDIALAELAVLFDKDTRVWCNGANFDEPLLADAYGQYGMRKPWAYKNVRCFRTLRALAPDLNVEYPALVKHDALDDALWQTEVILQIVNQMGIVLY